MNTVLGVFGKQTAHCNNYMSHYKGIATGYMKLCTQCTACISLHLCLLVLCLSFAVFCNQSLSSVWVWFYAFSLFGCLQCFLISWLTWFSLSCLYLPNEALCALSLYTMLFINFLPELEHDWCLTNCQGVNVMTFTIHSVVWNLNN